MWDQIFTWLEIGLLLLAIGGLLSAHRRAEKYLKLDYEFNSSPNSAAWRWRCPDAELELQVIDTDTSSLLPLPSRSLDLAEAIMVLFGYAILLVWLFLLGTLLLRGDFDWVSMLLISALFLPLGWTALHVGSHAVWIELQAEQMRVAMRYGFFFLRTRQYKRSPRLQFEGKLQNMLEMNREQNSPDYKLFIQKRGWLGSRREQRLFLRCHTKQAVWVTKGLQQWVCWDQTTPNISKV